MPIARAFRKARLKNKNKTTERQKTKTKNKLKTETKKESLYMSAVSYSTCISLESLSSNRRKTVNQLARVMEPQMISTVMFEAELSLVSLTP